MNRIAVGAIVVLGIVIGAFVVFQFVVLPAMVPVPRRADVWIPKNVVVLDSAQIAGSPRAYLFWYDAGAFGYTIRMVSLERPSHETAVLQSDYATRIRWTAADTLLVVLREPEYQFIGKRPTITVVPRVRGAARD